MAHRLRIKKNRILVAAALVGLALYGCAVGPDYQPPQPPDVPAYTSGPFCDVTSSAPVPCGQSQRLIIGRDIPGQWWQLFHSEELNKLIRTALEENQTLAAAKAALRQAGENLRAGYGSGLLPALDFNFSASREKFTGAAFGQSGATGSLFNLYNASVKVSYLFDIFGGVRRELEALQAQKSYQRFQLEGAYLTLSANVATTVIQEASLRSRIKATREILAEEEEQYTIVQNQFELGAVSRSDVLAQVTQLSQTRATLPPLEKELYQTRHLLSVLLGKFPYQAGKLPEINLDNLELPRELPVSLPSVLARQRPDVLAAEALLHAASAQVGVATANLYPKITLTGSYGSETTDPDQLFDNSTMIWNIGAGLVQPLFHGEELRSKRRAALAAYDQSLAIYRLTVLQAFQNVADSLRALESDARALTAQAEAEEAARKSLNLTREQFKIGVVSFLTLLNAQRQYQQTRINLVQAQAARFADTVALYQALGGGWWPPTPGSKTPTQTMSDKEKIDERKPKNQ